MRGRSLAIGVALLCVAVGSSGLAADGVTSEFLFDDAPFRSCHASTVCETRDGLVAAWFGGTDEGENDVVIWVSRRTSGRWSKPVEVADGKVDGGKRHPCWNPVLYQAEQGPLLLFYKVGPSPSTWWGMVKESRDGGATWSDARRLPDGILGPIKDKPVRMKDGALLCPSSTEDAGWRVHFERTPDLGKTWTKSPSLGDGKALAIIQPTVLTRHDGRLQALCRSRQGKIVETWSDDQGKTWTPPTLTSLPNPNSGIDAVTLKDGRFLLVYNHTTKGRSPLNVAISEDGKTWKSAAVLESEPGEFSYPAVIESADGLVHVTYTWNRRRIRHATIDTAKLMLRDLPKPE